MRKDGGYWGRGWGRRQTSRSQHEASLVLPSLLVIRQKAKRTKKRTNAFKVMLMRSLPGHVFKSELSVLTAQLSSPRECLRCCYCDGFVGFARFWGCPPRRCLRSPGSSWPLAFSETVMVGGKTSSSLPASITGAGGGGTSQHLI